MQRKSTEERQEEIKKAILDIIATEGLHALSTRRLSQKVGLSEGALFRHFTSKRAMLLSIMQDVENDLLRKLRTITERKESAKKRLQDFLCAHIQYLIEHQGITILLFSEATHLNDSELKQKLRTILLTQKQFVSRIVQDGIAEGLWDPELQVENVVSLYLGIPITLNIELVLNPQNTRTENFCRRMICLLERILEKNTCKE